MGRTRGAVLALALLVGCAEPPGGPAEPVEGTAAGPAAQAAPTAPTELVPVAPPALDGLEPELVEQIEQALEGVRGGAPSGEPAPASAYGELGMLAQAHALWPTARDSYRDAALLDPEEFRWPYLLALCEREAGRLDEAAVALTRALALRSDYLPALVQSGEVELERGRAEEAEQRFERALELDPSCASALVGLGRIAAARGDQRAAAERFERALELQPRATALHYNAAQAYRSLGQSERAESHMNQRGSTPVAMADPVLREVMQRNHSTRLLIDRGRAAAQVGEWTQAEKSLRQAVARDPQQPSALLLLGLTLDQLGHPAEALDRYREALALEPDNPRSHYAIGLLLARQGDESAAIESLGRAIELDPGLKQARRELARAFERTSQTERALEQYERLLDDDPLNAEAELRRTLCLIRLGRYASAQERLEQSVSAFPDETAFPHMLARLLAASPDDAVRDGPRALRLIEELTGRLHDASFAETVAMALAETGRFDEAERWQRRALDIAERAGATERARGMERRLTGYSARKPCRHPWDDDDPLFRPPPEDRVADAGT